MRRWQAASLVLAAAALVWMFRAELMNAVASLPLGSPHERYTLGLRLRRLHTTEPGRTWLAAAQGAVEHPAAASPAFTESGRLDPDAGSAKSWRLPARLGQRLHIHASFEDERLFVDVFRADSRVRMATGDGRTPLSVEPAENGDVVLRIQAPLGIGGLYRVETSVQPTMIFPVQSVPTSSVQSGFGEPRDRGGRRHEGIDIFAPRGTPVVAAVDGWVTGTTSNRLGGNVVWIWSPTRRVATYYAHLDRQLVGPGDRVQAGDHVGVVGNTGNAQYTAPHLHFGIYRSRGGAVDPLPFVCELTCVQRMSR